MNVPPLTGPDIEASASACIRRCMQKQRLSEIPLPVPVENWIEGPLGIGFGVGDLSNLGPGVLGAAYIAEGEIMISQTLLNHEARYRFTCGHELGHFVLHGSVQPAFHDTAAEPGSMVQIERQADRFAAAFLMPATCLMQQLFQICTRHKMDGGYLLAALMEQSDQCLTLWREILLPGITQVFGVSRAAAIYRFRDLVLPTGLPFIPAGLSEDLLNG